VKNKMSSDGMKIHGYIMAIVTHPDMTQEIRVAPNLIMTEGFDHYLDAQFGTSPTKGTFLAIGTKATSLVVGDTALEGEVDRKGGTYTHTNNTAQGTVAYTFSTGGPWAIVEMGLLDALTTGTLISRGTFAAVNKGTADTFEGKYIHSLS
jgi:hypothetical protein